MSSLKKRVSTNYLILMKDSAAEWAHRVLVAAEESHMENPLDEYSKAFVEMREGWKSRKDCKDSIKAEQMARLVCYHPSTDQMVNCRIHTTPEGIVTKVEVEKKIKGKSVWVELKELSSE